MIEKEIKKGESIPEKTKKIPLIIKKLESTHFANKQITFSSFFDNLLRSVLISPDEMSNRICQKILDGENAELLNGFVESIWRMSQKGLLDESGLRKIIQTIKTKYQI